MCWLFNILEVVCSYLIYCCLMCNAVSDWWLFAGFGEGKYISFEERQWHQPCFKCSQCSVSLVGAGFFPDGERILCKDCNDK